ncbi:uncharacterized protein LOC124167151 [Ischnura elegans]|uniref:uncharacterized protein LOC124167151 n=1 Tax=Ischnura elegans TaxID=197161 RepID=UPI001ED87AD5|nr:uncharacterized protein LOC124167151 [Ischnura elegans]
MAQGELQLQNDTRRQKGKFERLSSRSEFTSSLDCNRVVINLTGKPLDSAKTSVLSKGLNFAPAPKSIPFLDFIGGVEQVIRKLPVEAADEIRSDVVMTLKRAVPPKPNLTREERNALQAIRRDPKIVVLPADKGNATVLMPTEEYHKKVNEILQDGSYRVLGRDPTDAIVRKTSALIKDTKMEPESKSNLTVRGAVPPRFYGLPKVHKNGIPLRPIVSAINAPTYNLARYLSSVLSPIVGHCVHHIKNSAEFVKTLGGIRLKPSDIMVSLDVVSLFTRVPLEDTFNILESKFDEMTVRLFRHVLKSTYFLYGGKYYEQMDGVPMGSPLSPAIANLFMEDFEEKALQSASLRPRYFFRYVDDTFVIWQHGRNTLDDFLSHMNQQHPNIKFTMEEENNNCIPFLDILIQRKPDGTLGHSVYRKPTHTNLYLNGRSHHHPSQKQGVLTTLIHRAKIVADAENLPAEIKHLKTTFKRNGYSDRDFRLALGRTIRPRKPTDEDNEKPLGRACIPYVSTISGKIGRILLRHNLQVIHRPPKKIRDGLVRVKDDLGLRVPGVYHIPCECGLAYVGETSRTVEARIKEHKRHIRLCQPEKSALAEHSLDMAHSINFDGTKILCRSDGYWDRIVKEGIEIRLEDKRLNRDYGQNISQIWRPLINKIQRSRSQFRLQNP